MLLLVVGVVIQTTVVQIQRTKHNRRQRLIANKTKRLKFNSFPYPSLFKRIINRRKMKCLEGEPLLTPGRLSPSGDRQWSPVHSTRLPSDGRWSPSSSGSHRNYGATGITSLNGTQT